MQHESKSSNPPLRLIDFAILDGYRTGMKHNPERNLAPFEREFGG